MKGILHNLYELQGLDSTGHKTDLSQVALLRASIPPGMLAHYDRVRARGKKGIARLRINVCTNCRMKVPIGLVASLRGGMIQTCGNCGIYLCFPDVDPAAVELAAAAPADVAPPKPARRKRQTAAAR